MKQMIGLLAALVLLLSFGATGLAEAPKTFQLQGIILEVTEEGDYLIDDDPMGEVLVKVQEDTIFEGQMNLEVGQYIFVTYNGMMTRSMPPQVSAQKIDCYFLDGAVTSLETDQSSMLVDSGEFGPVVVHLPEMDVLPQEGDNIRVYYSGVMALSYPGQVSGLKVDIYQKIQGEVRYVEEAFLLIGSEDSTILVNLQSKSEIPEGLEIGTEVTVYYTGMMTKSIPPQITAHLIETYSGIILN